MAEEKNDHGRFYDLLERLFKEIDQESIQAEVVALRAAKPEMSREQLALHLTKKAAMRVATVGAAAGVPGGALAVLAMAPDIFNLVLQQSRLVLSIAFLHDAKPHVKERFKEVLATLAVATGSSAGSHGVRVLISKGLEHAAAGALARKIFGRVLARRLPMVAPVLGTIVGGTINYVSMRAVGRAALEYYGSRAAPPPVEEPALEPPKPARRRAPAKKATAKTPRKRPASPRKRDD